MSWAEVGTVAKDLAVTYAQASVSNKIAKKYAPKPAPAAKKVSAPVKVEKIANNDSYLSRIPLWGLGFVVLLIVAVVWKLIKR